MWGWGRLCTRGYVRRWTDEKETEATRDRERDERETERERERERPRETERETELVLQHVFGSGDISNLVSLFPCSFVFSGFGVRRAFRYSGDATVDDECSWARGRDLQQRERVRRVGGASVSAERVIREVPGKKRERGERERVCVCVCV
jgi:hypothetical protein